MPESDLRWQRINEMLPQDDHARIVERQVNRLQRNVLDRLYQGVGKDAYDPVPLLKIILYEYLKGRRSPATWEEEARVNQAAQWLGRGYTPARRTWYALRDRLGDAIEDLHRQVVDHAINGNHLDPTTAAQDGTSIAACASRHRMLNRETLQKRQAIVQSAIDGRADQEQLPKWVPPTPGGRLELAERMVRAAEVLAERITQNAEKRSGKRKDPDKIQVSLTDPIAPLGRDKLKVYRPLYTIQYLVDPVSHLIVSYSCEASPVDAGTLAPMIDKTQSIVGGRLKTVLADGGYCSILDLRDAQQRNIELIAPPSASGTSRNSKSHSGEVQIPREAFTFDASSNCYRCPAGKQLLYKDREKMLRQGGRHLYQFRYQGDASACQSCSLRSRCLGGSGPRMIKRMEGEELLEAQRSKMSEDSAKERYRLRGQTVERGFGDAKGNRNVSRFHGRGLARARTETGLLTLAQNLLRLDNLQRSAINPSDCRT